MEITLLLVDPDQLPAELEQQLVARGAFVEVASSRSLEPSIIAVVPNLIVGASSPELDDILRVLGRQKPRVQMVVLANFKEHKELRARRDPLIGALLSGDTSPSLLARRIVELANKAAQGEPLERNASGRQPKQTPPEKQPFNDKVPRKPSSQEKRLSTDKQISRKPSSQEKQLSRKPSPQEKQKLPAKTPLEVAPRAVSLRPTRAPRAPASRSSRPPRPSLPPKSTVPPRPTLPPKSTAPSRSTLPHQPIIPLEPVPLTQSIFPPRPSLPSNSIIPLEPAPPSIPTSEPPPPRESTSSTSSYRPVPAERIPLTFSQRPLPPLRLALVDADLTRAGVLADELRARGVTTHLVAPDLDGTRWHLLRRFSPHGLVLDEDTLGRHTAWLDAVRHDPFLRHCPFLTIPLSRMFQEDSGLLDTSLLIPHLLPLGTEETALRDQLGPNREIELRLDQIGPVRALEVLAARPQPARLECTDGDAQLLWSFKDGHALPAELGGAPLTPHQALEWLLAHPACRLLARELTEAPQSPGSVSVGSLLDTATNQKERRGPAKSTLRKAVQPQQALHGVDPQAREGARGKLASREPGVGPAKVLTSLEQLARRRLAWVRTLSPKARYALLATSAGLLVLLLYFALRTDRASAEDSMSLPSDEAIVLPSSPARPPGASSGRAGENAHQLFRVAADSKLPPCDQSVSVAGESTAQAASYLQRARQLLVAGDIDAARLSMCKAARLAPAGPASEGLAQIYLSGRSYENARHWAETAREHDPERRSIQELVGDIRSQLGNSEEARRLWLSTLRLDGTETAKLGAVSRSLIREAQRASKSDLPRAERLLRRAVTLDPESAGASAALAQVFLGLGLHDAARNWARRAVELDTSISKELSVELRALLSD